MGSVPHAEDVARPSAVSVSLQELKNGSVDLETLETAFGPESLGIIVVRDLPEEFVGLRRKVLSYASYLANLPREELGESDPFSLGLGELRFDGVVVALGIGLVTFLARDICFRSQWRERWSFDVGGIRHPVVE